MNWYYRILAKQPYLIILGISVLSLACMIVSIFLNTVPNFNDPTLGFEARGSDIGCRLTAWYNLNKETGLSGKLASDPSQLENFQEQIISRTEIKIKASKQKYKKKRRKKLRNRNKMNNKKQKNHKTKSHLKKNTTLTSEKESSLLPKLNVTNGTLLENKENETEKILYGSNEGFVEINMSQEHIRTKNDTWRTLEVAYPQEESYDFRLPTDGYFCDYPRKEYSHFVIKRIGKNFKHTLFDIDSILAICELQEQITSVKDYKEYCQTEMSTSQCCRPWSLATYAALNSNKSSCFDLTTEDVLILENLLTMCFKYYREMKLNNDCSDVQSCYAPVECIRNNITFNILHFLTDYNFIKSDSTNNFLKYTVIFVPVIHDEKILPLFYEWDKTNLRNSIVQVIAMDLGLENVLFNELLVNDWWLIALGAVLILMSMWLYTSSLFITIMSCIAECFSLGLAYYIYTIVLKMTFFPFMNLLAIIVIIGIGCDDAFIFIKIWNSVIDENCSSPLDSPPLETKSFESLFALTLRHAAISMFVTSLTTAAAFFASYTSNITSIKCFGIFAGIAVITNFLMMVTWLPASISIMERLPKYSYLGKLHIHKLMKLIKTTIDNFCNSFGTIIVSLVMKYSYMWILLFGCFGLLSVGIVLYWPGIQLPEKSHLQLFVSDHPFEIYNAKLKNEFWFEKTISNFENFKIPLRFVWGVLPIDDGDYADPYSRGELHFDNNFNMSAKTSQAWLLTFCQHLRQQNFLELTFGQLQPNCFVENFISLMDRVCFDGMSGTDHTPCCEISKFPYEPSIFDYCLPQIISLLYATPRQFFIPCVAGPKFIASNDFNTSGAPLATMFNNTVRTNFVTASVPQVRALVVDFSSNVSFTTIYSDMKYFLKIVEDWFTEEMKSAPLEMKNGWFTSELKFFDVQDTLSKGTILSIIISMCTALIVLLFVTFNLLISLYAVLTVCLSIFTTIAILIGFGWTLGILESVTVSTAIGLAVDFSLHYSIHYRMASEANRVAAALFALKRIVGPSAMAAVTTCIGGFLMLASNVMPYIQIGVFLAVIMTISWFFATFFLISLLKNAGPQNGFIQLNNLRRRKGATSTAITQYERYFYYECTTLKNSNKHLFYLYFCTDFLLSIRLKLLLVFYIS